ncbi:MAG: hypothetical protein HFH14_02230 [Lachnospiraceae bacterium]|nr:hypothetical protein [Lachnospiraceae bacterium]
MTQDEKLKLFFDAAMEDAGRRNETAVSEFRNSLESSYDEHVINVRESAEAKFKVGRDSLIRECNSEISRRQIELRREFAAKQEEYRKNIFDRVTDKLIQYKNTPEYVSMLKAHIKKAEEYAGDDSMTIYVDATDEELIKELSASCGANVAVCDRNIMGGIRAEIPAKNVLIDESFTSKLEEAGRNFNF